LNGKKFACQGVAILPFVDGSRLKKAVKSLFDELTEDESKSFSRNFFLSHFGT
jgi:5'-3' exoribonuclease 2